MKMCGVGFVLLVVIMLIASYADYRTKWKNKKLNTSEWVKLMKKNKIGVK